MKIICDDKIPFLKGALEPYAQVEYCAGAAIDASMVRDADVLVVRTRTRCDEALLSGSRVQFVVTATIGYDHIDTAWCARHGVQWTNCPGCNAASVAQYIASCLCALARKYSIDFTRTTVGVVGVGHVGSRVAAVASALGCRLLLCDPPRARREGGASFVSLDDIMRESDIITLHVPLSREGEDATYHLFDEARMARLTPAQTLINSSRGEVVDNAALKEALCRGALRTAILDVWENEPRIDTALLEHLFAGTPHIAGYSQDGKANGTTMSVQAIGQKYQLPCAHWQVTDVPAPLSPARLTLNAQGLSAQEIMMQAIEHTYRVSTDDARLRASVSTFEAQRGAYPIRREFSAYTLHLVGAPPATLRSLQKIGFKVE